MHAKLIGGPLDGLVFPVPRLNVHMVVRDGGNWHSYSTPDQRAEDVAHGIVALGPTYGATETDEECCEYAYVRTLSAQEVQFLRQSITKSVRRSRPKRGAEDIRGD
jgi:hypothetical protein